MLCIIIGVASVITMLAIGQGSKESIRNQISEMGSNMIMIMPGTDMRGGVRQSSDDMQKLKPADYASMQEGMTYVKGISPEVSSQGQFINGNNNYPPHDHFNLAATNCGTFHNIFSIFVIVAFIPCE